MNSGRISFSKTNTRNLRKSLSNNPGLEFIDVPEVIAFNSECPSATDNINIQWSWNKVLSSVPYKGLIFSLTGFHPFSCII